MLAALEDGCRTRSETFAHQGRFSLLNNGAAELRAAGVPVDCVLVDGDYVYLLSDGGRSNTPHDAISPAPSIAEQDDGQLAWEVAA